MTHVDLSDQLLAFVEIPKGRRNKYEFDEGIGRIVLDRFLSSSMVYPADYGFLSAIAAATAIRSTPGLRLGADLPRLRDPGQPGRDVRDEGRDGDRRQDRLRAGHDPGWNTRTSLEEHARAAADARSRTSSPSTSSWRTSRSRSAAGSRARRPKRRSARLVSARSTTSAKSSHFVETRGRWAFRVVAKGSALPILSKATWGGTPDWGGEACSWTGRSVTERSWEPDSEHRHRCGHRRGGGGSGEEPRADRRSASAPGRGMFAPRADGAGGGPAQRRHRLASARR